MHLQLFAILDYLNLYSFITINYQNKRNWQRSVETTLLWSTHHVNMKTKVWSPVPIEKSGRVHL